MDIYKIIQGTIQNSVENMKLTDYNIGIVTALEPLIIKFDESKVIEDIGDNIFYTEQVLEKKINLEHKHTTSILSHSHTVSNLGHSHGYSDDYTTDDSLRSTYETSTELGNSYDTSNDLGTYVITEGIKAGDKLLILKVSGGQKFIILSKLRDKKSVTIDANNIWNWSD